MGTIVDSVFPAVPPPTRWMSVMAWFLFAHRMLFDAIDINPPRLAKEHRVG